FGPDQLRFLDEDVLRQIDVHGPGTTGGGDVERLTNDRADVLAVLHEEVVLRAGPGDPDVVRLLERVVADARRRHLPRERDDGNRVHHRVLQRGHEVGRGRPRGHQTDTDLPRRARVAFGRMAGGGLLADEDVTQT